MPHIIIKKWIEPYILLETAKKHYEMRDFTFDGFSKKNIQAEFLKALEAPYTFGLYMKNVNKFYLFTFSDKVDIEKLFNLKEGDFEFSEEVEKPFNLVDMGKAEAGIIKFS